LGLLPEAELDARYSVLESAVNRFGTPEHWVKINAKLKLLGEEDKRIRFWVVSGDPGYEYGNRTRRFAPSPRPAGHARHATCPIILIR
jgi:two-component system heavy metal sensor histidine kinase CusS